MTVALLSQAGVPPTAGFLGKFYIFSAGVEIKQWWLLGAMVLGSVLGLFYYLRVMIIMFQPIPGRERVSEPLNWVQNASGVMLMIAAALVALLIFDPDPLLNLISASTLVIK
jgi:NADH-quinone oxidoreductase subunit N